MIELAGSILGLVVLILKEYFAANSESAKADQAFKLDQAMFQTIVARALAKLRSDAKAEAGQAGKVEDQVDAEIGKKPNA